MAATSIQLLRFAKSPSEFAEVLKPVQTPVPTQPLGSHQVRIRMTLRPIDPADVFSIMGVYPGFQPGQFPTHPGLEGVGVVHAVGSGVTQFKVGQRVIPGLWEQLKGGKGAWQAYLDMDVADVFPVPDGVSDEAACQIPVNPLTVLGMLDRLKLRPGQWILQSAAGSTLGRQLVAIAKQQGLKTINLVRRNDPLQINDLKKLGADAVVVTQDKSREAIVQEIQALTQGQGADGAVDAVAGECTGILASAVKPGASVLVYGLMSGLKVDVLGPDLLFRGVNVTGFWVGPYIMSLPLAARQTLVQQALDYFQKGILDAFVGEKYPLDQVAQALAKQNIVGRGGKIFLSS